MASTEQEAFAFKEIRLLKSNVLGAGSYGKVCRAMCDGLACAAKIIHPTLFDLSDPGAASFMQKFDEECRLLRRVRHPNIVMYLGTYSDPVTRLPVLLMELCDDSLTKFLESSLGCLDYHVELNIIHDIALALVYLHSNHVIHRDLTSNNVLMIAGSRAKVTDFGMSRLTSVNPRMTPLTQCPGNLLYMSPEALAEVPSYSKKLDVFSLGVLVIQILTRKFPNPTARFSVVDVSHDPKFGSRTVNVPVAETERRSEHIKLISETHPLKQLALDCLKDVDKMRPSSTELSAKLLQMKESQEYKESVAFSHGYRARINSLRQQVKDLKQKERKHQQKLTHQQRDVEFQQHQLLQEVEEEMQRFREREKQLEEDSQSFTETEKALRAIVDSRNRELQASQQMVVQLQQTFQQKDKEIHTLQQTVSTLQMTGNRPPMVRAGSLVEQAVPESRPPVARPPPQEIQGTHIALRFDRNITAPHTVKRGAAVVFGNTAFISPEASSQVYQITNGMDHWIMLPEHPFASFGLAVFDDGCVTSVGGWNGTTYTNQLLTLSREQRWVYSRFPPMLTARIEGAIISSPHVLVVAGGYDGQSMLDTVEVLTFYTLQWTKVCRLPHPFYMACGSLCNGQLYLAGGYVAPDLKSKSVLTCSLVDLLHSQPSVESSLNALSISGVTNQYSVWREAAKLPYTKCTLLTNGGQLLAVGGKDDTGQASASVLTYDPHSNAWRHVSNLIVPRNQCFALTFPKDVIYIVGGDPANLSIEVMTAMKISVQL